MLRNYNNSETKRSSSQHNTRENAWKQYDSVKINYCMCIIINFAYDMEKEKRIKIME